MGKFKVGDRVKALTDAGARGRVDVGEPGTVVEVKDRGSLRDGDMVAVRLDRNGDRVSQFESRWEKVERKFRVGDRVQQVGDVPGNNFTGVITQVSNVYHIRRDDGRGDNWTTGFEWAEKEGSPAYLVLLSFRKGDRVKYTGTYTYALIGKTGTVREDEAANNVNVDWDVPCAATGGVMPENIQKIDEKEDNKVKTFDMNLKVGDRVRFAVEYTGREALGEVVTVHGDGRYSVRRDDGRTGSGTGGSWLVVSGSNDWIVAEAPAVDATPLAALRDLPNSKRVTGVVLRWTADLVKVGSRYEIGCKYASIEAVLTAPEVKSVTKNADDTVAVVFEAAFTLDSCGLRDKGLECLSVEIAGQSVSADEISRNGREFFLVSAPEPKPEPTVALASLEGLAEMTLSLADARALRDAVGNMSTGGPNVTAIYRALRQAVNKAEQEA